MTVFTLSKTGLIHFIVFSLIRGCECRHFPLNGCSTDSMDILFLYYETGFEFTYMFQKDQCIKFAEHLLNFPSITTTPRVMFAAVYDRFSSVDPFVNVSSWQFQTSLQSETYGFNMQQARKQDYSTINEVIKQKVAFTERLFSEMGGVRENVTRVAVIYLEDVGLSYEERNSLPQIVEQQKVEIKIFVVVITGEIDSGQTVHRSDTLLGSIFSLPVNILTLAICNQCMEGWFTFRHPVSLEYLSCYRFVKYDSMITWLDAYNDALSYGSLATIETAEELHFIKTTMFSFLEKHYNESSDDIGINDGSVYVYLGLQRDYKGAAKRYHWARTGLFPYRPLVVNNWLPGKPSGGYSNACSIWTFSWDRSLNQNATNNDDRFVDGWMDVNCSAELSSLSLCEVVLPRKIEEQTLMIIEPATNESLSQAVNKRDFIKFGENIVSISVNIANFAFLQFLKDKNLQFPVFDCGEEANKFRYISYLFVCDSVDHCSNKRDEIFCTINKNTLPADVQMYTNKCYGVHCCNGACLPVPWVNDGEVDCRVCDVISGKETNDERDILNKYLKRNETCAFICNKIDCVHFSQLNDGRIDCTGPEGPIDETLGKLQRADSCYNVLGHMIWAPKCVYVKDMLDTILGCRDLSHLKNCSNFKCPEGYIQCTNTYCIPQHYILDGKVDCPTGEDEQTDLIGPCAGNFACWNSRMCLHPNLVCDGHPECPYKDDEAGCKVSCADGFRCVSGTVTVSNYNRSIPLKNVQFIDSVYRYLDLSGLDLSQMDHTFSTSVRNIPIIRCSLCNIRIVPVIFNSFSDKIQDLDFAYNVIQELDGRDFFYHTLENIRRFNLSNNRELSTIRGLTFRYLETLDLSHTALSCVNESDFAGLWNLKHLDLSFTSIVFFHKTSFPSKLILQRLDLRGLLVKDFFENVLNGLTISHDLYTDNYELCCPQVTGTNIPYHTCHGPDNAISSCFDLLAANVQRVLLWMVAVVAILGNLTVIVYRTIWDRSVLRTSYGLFVTNLGFSDFIMGVYLFIIIGADYYYRGFYVLHDKTWRESVACRLAGFLATLSSETSIFFIFLVTLDRFLIMKFPFGQIKFSHMSKIIVVIFAWIVGFLFALAPIIFNLEIYSTNAMCLGLPLTAKRIKGWEFSFGVFIAFNALFCLAIACGQRAIFQAMSANRIAGPAGSSSPRRIENVLVAKQLSLVGVSNFLCWFPIGVTGLMSLCEHQINNSVYSWITVVVLPINSAANPLLYTIPALLSKWEQFKSGGTKASASRK